MNVEVREKLSVDVDNGPGRGTSRIDLSLLLHRAESHVWRDADGAWWLTRAPWGSTEFPVSNGGTLLISGSVGRFEFGDLGSFEVEHPPAVDRGIPPRVAFSGSGCRFSRDGSRPSTAASA